MIKITITLALLLITHCAYAQTNEYPYPSLSPKGTISQIVGNTTIQLEYERPSARQRKIFGHLVPWNTIWRTGAGHCTKISFDNDVIVGSQPVTKGTYSVLTIPDHDEWIVILNADTTLYGSYNYDSNKDIARFKCRSRTTSRFYETLTADIEIIPNNARIYFSWEHTQISLDVITSTDEEIEQFISNELSSRNSTDPNIYAGAAEYLFYKGHNLKDALAMADIAITLDNNNGWARSLKIRIYESLKLYDDAIDEINRAIENIQANRSLDQTEKERDVKQYSDDLSRIKNLKHD